jgi:uncharacterized protein (DUF1810 family)
VDPPWTDLVHDGVVADDRYDLERFVKAQDHGVYSQALDELRGGVKRGHWMWFVFPQVAGLGHSPTAQHYAITSLGEARAYLAHPLLGPRLRECAAVVAGLPPGPVEIFGGIDAMKLRSSMTLFRRAAPDEPLFQQVLDRHFGGVADPMTDQILGAPRNRSAERQ